MPVALDNCRVAAFRDLAWNSGHARQSHRFSQAHYLLNRTAEHFGQLGGFNRGPVPKHELVNAIGEILAHDWRWAFGVRQRSVLSEGNCIHVRQRSADADDRKVTSCDHETLPAKADPILLN